MRKHNAKLTPLIRIGLRARGRREAEPSNAALPGQMGLDL